MAFWLSLSPPISVACPAISVLNGNGFLSPSPKLTDWVSCLPVSASTYPDSSDTSDLLISYFLPQLF